MTSSEKVKAIYKVTDTHVFGFFNEHRYLSNFHLHSITYEDILYPSNENAYQAAKILEGSVQPSVRVDGVLRPITRLDFASYDPSGAKSKGRSVNLRADWLQILPLEEMVKDTYGPLIVQVRDKIMYDLNVIKFSSPTMVKMLLDTGDKYLEETNWWKDDYWGVCHDKMSSRGLNKLGRILMKIRDETRKKLKEAA